MIELRNIYFGYKKKIIFENFSLSVTAEPKIIGVFGSPNSGKTVLLKLIATLLTPSSGEIFIQHKKISSLSSQELDSIRKNIGMAFQNHALLDDLTVLENILFPILKDGKIENYLMERAQEYLKLVGLETAAHLYPHEISGGMQKRVSVLRAMIHHPSIMLFDDPTSGLDPVLSKHILNTIKLVHEHVGSISFIVSQKILYIWEYIHEVIVLKDKKIFHGSKDDISMEHIMDALE